MAHHITHRLESGNILYDLQHDFCRHRSCKTRLLSLVNNLMASFDHNIQNDLVLMDLSKAFDCVPHERLLYKLNWYGVRGHLHQWIRAFLTGRRQQVILNGVNSSIASVVSGVPQVSVLGPLLFIIYIKTFHSTLSTLQSDSLRMIVYFTGQFMIITILLYCKRIFALCKLGHRIGC